MKDKMSAKEWKQYQTWKKYPNKANDNKQLLIINQEGKSVDRIHPTYGVMKAFEVNGCELFPATETAKVFGYRNPKTTASQSPHKELWRVEKAKKRKTGEQSITFIERNYIPEEDVRRMARLSKRSDAEAILSWIMGEEREECK